MNSLIDSNGRYTENKTGDQGWQEAERQDSLQLQARETDGVSQREERDYVIHIENSSEFKSAFVVKKIKTKKELIQGICDRHPQLCHDSILMRVSDTRMGSIHRVFYEQQLPQHTDTLYVQLSLRKHTPLFQGKIEKQ